MQSQSSKVNDEAGKKRPINGKMNFATGIRDLEYCLVPKLVSRRNARMTTKVAAIQLQCALDLSVSTRQIQTLVGERGK